MEDTNHSLIELMDALNRALDQLPPWGRWEWTPYDMQGHQYIVDDTQNGKAFLLTLAPYKEG
jgi:hypothetical protein